MTDDARKLLAGYATNTLTEAEREALFAAALEDGELFAALSDEQSLRELLDDPAARRELLARIEPAEPGVVERLTAWMTRPAVLAGAGVAALGVVLVSVIPRAGLEPKVVEPPPAAAEIQAPRSPEPERKAAPAPTARKQAAKRFEVPQPKPTAVPAPQTVEPLAELRADVDAQRSEKATGAGRDSAAPAAPATQFARSEAAASMPVLRYELAVRSEDGWTAVPPDTLLAAGSTVRVRILSTEAGTLTDGKTHWRIAPDRPHDAMVTIRRGEQQLEFALLAPARAARAAFNAQPAAAPPSLPPSLTVILRSK